MSRTAVVSYKTHPEVADENQRLLEQVFAQLQREQNKDVRFAAFRLADGVSFVHVVQNEGDTSLLAGVSTFQEWLRESEARFVEPPVASLATLIGSNRFLPE